MAFECKFCNSIFVTQAEIATHQTLTGHTGVKESGQGISLKDALIFGVGAVSEKEKQKHKGKRFAWSWRS